VTLHFAPTGDIKQFRGDDHEATLWFPGGGIVAARVRGHVREKVATAIYAAIDAHSSKHGFPGIGFGDFEELTDFDWEARMVLVRWNLKHRNAAQRLHLLVGSPVVQLGLRIMTIALGDTVVVHENRATIEAAYASLVRMTPAAGG
jgi:hypothetical protein